MVLWRLLLHLVLIVQVIAASEGDIGVDGKCQRPRVFLHMGHSGGPMYFFMYFPIIATMRQAFEEKGASVGLLDESDHGRVWSHSLVLEAIDACSAVHSRPVLMSVGWPWGNFAVAQFLRTASSRGAYLAMYQAEFLAVAEAQYMQWIHPTSMASYGAAELWDFSNANVQPLRDLYQDSDIKVRFMPPGYSTYLDAGVSLPNLTKRLQSIGFIGILTGRDPNFVHQMLAELASSNLTLSGTQAIWDLQSLTSWLAQFPVVLNLHKGDTSMTGCTECGVESFRMSLLLSNKACLVSTTSHSADEKRYAGMVRFAAPSQIPAALRDVSRTTTTCQSASYELFKVQHTPASILEHSGFLTIWPFSPPRRTTPRRSSGRGAWSEWQRPLFCLYLLGVVVSVVFAVVYKLRVVDVLSDLDVSSRFEDEVEDHGLNVAPAGGDLESPWTKHNLMSCFHRSSMCVQVGLCWPCVAAKNYDVSSVTEYWPACFLITASYHCCCFGALVRTYMSTRLKRKFGVTPSPCTDVCLNCCCVPCEVGRESLTVDRKLFVEVSYCFNVAHVAEDMPFLAGRNEPVQEYIAA